jgi:hypothetical protein
MEMRKGLSVLNDAEVSPNAKKATNFCLTVCIEAFFKAISYVFDY